VEINALASVKRFSDAFAFDEYNLFSCHGRPMLSEEEKRFADTLECFGDIPTHDWAAIRREVDLKLSAKLLAFAVRMASAAAREGEDHFLKSGFMALVLDNNVIDERDIYLVACILGDAAHRLGVSVDAMIRSTALFATNERSTILRNGFLRGPSYMRSLKSMGVELIDTPDGLAYRVNLF
jgi:hypothetical protein